MKETKLNTLWFKHIKSEEDQVKFKKMVLACPDVLERLAEIINSKLSSSESVLETEFDSPSWAYKQAFKLGKKAALEELKVLTAHLNNK